MLAVTFYIQRRRSRTAALRRAVALLPLRESATWLRIEADACPGKGLWNSWGARPVADF
jgi:hypothetical protein